MPIPGYYGQYMAPTYVVRDQRTKVREEKTKSQDKLLIDTLKLLAAFFPGSSSPDGPLEEIRLYRLSFLFDRIAALLRNDAIIDITLRKELYAEVLTFVQVSRRIRVDFDFGSLLTFTGCRTRPGTRQSSLGRASRQEP
jgi:hypothetical protein